MTRIILDEGVPRPLAKWLRAEGLDAASFPNRWKQLSNGRLLDRVVSEGFDVLITNDNSMSYQQSLVGRALAVLVLPTNRLLTVRDMVPAIIAALPALTTGRFAQLRDDGQLTFIGGDD